MVGKRLKDLRDKKGISQYELAKDIGTTQKQIYSWENDVQSPKAEALIKIAEYFDVSVDYLLGLVSDPQRTLIESDLSNDEQLLIRHLRAGTFMKLFQFIAELSKKEK